MGCFRAVALWLIFTASLHAQTLVPNPVLTTIFPSGGQAGSTFDVTVTGADLDAATRLHFSTSGIESKPRLNAQNKQEPGKFTVTIPPDTTTGVCEVRVVARYGISNPRGFAIGRQVEMMVPDIHTSADQAFKAKLGSALNGHAVKNAATFITFEAKKGQRLFVICHPAELDSRMDAAVTVADAHGRVRERLKPDGILDFTPEEDGTYTIKVNDLTFRGGDEFAWRLALTTAPLVEYVFSDGKSATLYGRNLPGGVAGKTLTKFGKPLEKLSLPEEKALALIAASTGTVVRFDALSEADDADATKPFALKPPCAFTGWFPARGKPRGFTFDAKKGDVLWLEVTCAAKGLPADPFLIVEKMTKAADGKEGYTPVGEAYDIDPVSAADEFMTDTRDPSYRFEAKEDGTYRIQVRDSFCNSASAPRFPFELSVQPVGTAFALVTLPMALPKAKAARTADFGIAPLWRNGVTAMKVVTLRKRGFTGPILLRAEGSPAGITCLGGLIEEGKTSGYITFRADENAADWAGSIKVHGKAGAAGESSSSGATLLWKVADSQKEGVFARRTQDVGLSVVTCDVAPVLVEAADAATIEVADKSKVVAPLKVSRRADFTEAFKLAVLGAGTADAPIEIDVPANAKEAKLEVDATKLKLTPGDHSLVLRGTAKFKHRRGDDPKAAPKDMTFVVFSKPIAVHVKAAEKK